MVILLQKFQRVVSSSYKSLYPIRHGFSCIHSLVEFTSRKLIKPLSPTPHHQRFLNLSLLDQLLPPTLYGTILFFYTPTTNRKNVNVSEIERLQASLSKALVHFYPLAGRLKGPAAIECNDEGAYFIEARVKCQLSEFLKQPEPNLLNSFIPHNDPKTSKLALGSAVLLVQISVFSCGGITIAVCPSHKIADGTSLYTFVRTWAAINRNDDDDDQYDIHGLVLPEFNIGASLLPSKELSMPITNTLENLPTQNLTTRRFVFDVSKLASLKAEIEGLLVQKFSIRNVTNVQIVLAIILRSAIAASRDPPRPTVLSQMVNLRRRMVPAIPENAMGNWFWSLPVVFKENETELHELVGNMRKGLTDFCNDKVQRFKGEDGFLVVSESLKEKGDHFKRSSSKGINLYWSTSLCKFPLYEMDFGWGRPLWVTSPSEHKNLIVLMDTKGGDGIEAWVTLDQQQMAMFECDEELLAFGSLNPST